MFAIAASRLTLLRCIDDALIAIALVITLKLEKDGRPISGGEQS
jgi:hypothetical protein